GLVPGLVQHYSPLPDFPLVSKPFFHQQTLPIARDGSEVFVLSYRNCGGGWRDHDAVERTGKFEEFLLAGRPTSRLALCRDVSCLEPFDLDPRLMRPPAAVSDVG